MPVLSLYFDHIQVALDREEKDEYNVLIAAGRRGVIRGKEILAVSSMKSRTLNITFVYCTLNCLKRCYMIL